MEGLGEKIVHQDDEGYGHDGDDGEEAGGVAVMEEVARFEVVGVEGVGEEGAGVEEAVGGVERPDAEEHGGQTGGGEVDTSGAGDEPGPEGGYGGGVEGEEVPEVEGSGWNGFRGLIGRGLIAGGLLAGWLLAGGGWVMHVGSFPAPPGGVPLLSKV